MTDLANKDEFSSIQQTKELKSPVKLFVTKVAVIIVLAIFGYYIGMGDIAGAISALIIVGFIWWSSR